MSTLKFFGQSKFRKIVYIKDFEQALSVQTLRRWEESGYLLPVNKSKGKTRDYDLEELSGKEKLENELTVAYA